MTIYGERLPLADAEAWLYPGAFAPIESWVLYRSLYERLEWQESAIKLFGRRVKSPRLSVWYGDKPYTYSGLAWPVRVWPPELVKIRQRVEILAGQAFNGVLCNLYRDGRDSMGWHSDDEQELGPDPVLASVVFGAGRRFVFRSKAEKIQKQEVVLDDGDILIMGAGTQSNWSHAVPKTSKLVGPRINLTFRWIV